MSSSVRLLCKSPFSNVAVPFSECLRSKAQAPASGAQRSRLPSRSSGWKRIGSGSGPVPDPLSSRTVRRNGLGVGEGGNGRGAVPAFSLCTLTLLLRAGKPRSAEETRKEFGTPEVSSCRVATADPGFGPVGPLFCRRVRRACGTLSQGARPRRGVPATDEKHGFHMEAPGI